MFTSNIFIILVYQTIKLEIFRFSLHRLCFHSHLNRKFLPHWRLVHTARPPLAEKTEISKSVYSYVPFLLLLLEETYPIFNTLYLLSISLSFWIRGFLFIRIGLSSINHEQSQYIQSDMSIIKIHQMFKHFISIYS